MTVRLRPHHLLCLLTFVGKGYTPAFTANLAAIARRIADGEEVVVVAGPDDVCAPLLAEAGAHCLLDSVVARDAAAARDVGDLIGRVVRPGERFVLDAGLVGFMRSAFAEGRTRSACAGCEWQDLCTGIAAADYRGTVVPGYSVFRSN